MQEEIIIPPMDIPPEELARRLFQLLPDPPESDPEPDDQDEEES